MSGPKIAFKAWAGTAVSFAFNPLRSFHIRRKVHGSVGDRQFESDFGVNGELCEFLVEPGKVILKLFIRAFSINIFI
jgi:hypothetical protein